MELENINEYFETKVFQDFGQNSKSYHVNGCNDITRPFEMARNNLGKANLRITSDS